MPYFGGKSQAGTFQRIINLIPPHRTYIEPFVGGGAILKRKAPAARSIACDLVAASELALPAGVEFIAASGIGFLENHRFVGGEFVYCDPPYLHSTRKSRARYRYELTDADHVRLLRALLALPCPVLLSGYPSALYDGMLTGWNREEFQVMTRGHSWATEVLWFNYPRPTILHDVSYVGSDYRERLRIKRKKERWAARFKKMPVLERAALFSALVDAMGAKR